MILPKIGRTNMIKGVSALSVLALVTIGMAGIGSFEDIPEDMLGKTDADLEALMDPLAEELAYDHSRRALAEYRQSRGLFSCEGECIENKRRWLEAERDLLSVAQQRAAARKAARKKAAGGGSGTVPSMADRQAAAKARQAARAAKRRGINVKPAPAPAPATGGGTPPAPVPATPATPPSYMSPREAAQARAAERKRQRAADKAARIAAAQAARPPPPPVPSPGSSPVPPPAPAGPRMTPKQRQAARKAERLRAAAEAAAAAKAAAKAAEEAAKAAEEAAAEEARASMARMAMPCEQRYTTCRDIQVCHHDMDGIDEPLESKIAHWESYITADTSAMLRTAELRIVEQQAILDVEVEKLPGLKRQYDEWVANNYPTDDYIAQGFQVHPDEMVEVCQWKIDEATTKIAAEQAKLAHCLDGFTVGNYALEIDHRGPYNPIAEARTFGDFFSHYLGIYQRPMIALAYSYQIVRILNDQMTAEQRGQLRSLEEEADMTWHDVKQAEMYVEHHEAQLAKYYAGGFDIDDDDDMYKSAMGGYDNSDHYLNEVHFSKNDLKNAWGEFYVDQDALAKFVDPYMPKNDLSTSCDYLSNNPGTLTSAGADKRASLSDSELEEFMTIITAAGGGTWVSSYGHFALAKLAAAKEREENPSECTDFIRLDVMRQEFSRGNRSDLLLLEHFDASGDKYAVRYEARLRAAKTDRCIKVGLFQELRDRQNNGEVLTDAVQQARRDMQAARNVYDNVVANENGVCTTAYQNANAVPSVPEAPSPPSPTPPMYLQPTAEISRECQEAPPSFLQGALDKENSYTEDELSGYANYAQNMPLWMTMVDDPFSTTVLSRVAEAVERYATPSSCTDIVRYEVMNLAFGNDDISSFYFIPDFDVSAYPTLVRYEQRLQAAKLTKCITSKLYEQSPVDATKAAMDTAVVEYEQIVGGGKGNEICKNTWYTMVGDACVNFHQGCPEL